ncbi:MAG: general secretion pathway protein GspB [Woeseiaceae bacterium]
MSLILDALRKSDHEHSERRAPDVARSQPTTEPSRVPRWVWPVVALLIINMAILIWVLAGSRGNPAAPTRTSPQQTRLTEAPPVVDEGPASVGTEVRSLLAETINDTRAARENPIIDAPIETGRTVRSLQSEATTDSTPKTEPPKASSNNGQGVALQQVSETTISAPLYDPVQAADDWQLDKLTLELHVYSEQPSARFGFINGQKVTEGSRLQAGPTVIEINRQGVVLEYRSSRFQLMP